MTTQPNGSAKPTDAAAMIATVEAGLNKGAEYSQQMAGAWGFNNYFVSSAITEGREAFRELLAHLASVERDNAELRAFVEDVRDSKARVSNDEECVMAFVRFGNEAARLLK